MRRRPRPPVDADPAGRRRGGRFLPLYALANAGGVVAYAPLLTLLLPARMAALAGEARVEWLGAATLAGAVSASISNVLFGWASDVAGSRRLWTAAGLFLTLASYALIGAAASPTSLIVAVAVYQVALNMMLAPLAAWAADVVPDHDKGLLGGLLGAGPLFGALAGVVATLPVLPPGGARLGAVCALVLILTAPLLLLARGTTVAAGPAAARAGRSRASHADFALLWTARLLVQVAGNTLFGFLVYYFRALPEPLAEMGVARLSALSLLIAFPLTLALGRLSDRLGPRKPFLVGAAAGMAAGLGVMASNTAIPAAMTGYALFACGLAVFLSLQSGYAMQLLPSPGRHGRDLGVLNLANTLPAVAAPVLAVWLVPARGFGALLAVLAALIIVAGLCTLLVRSDTQRS